MSRCVAAASIELTHFCIAASAPQGKRPKACISDRHVLCTVFAPAHLRWPLLLLLLLLSQVNADAGAATAGFMNLQRSYGGKVAIRNFPGATAATAVGNAAAGGLSLAYSETGKAQIGDYDQENDSPENDVAATTRGRGTAEAGLISIAIAPNDDASALGDVRATANQGSAVAGAFTETNAYQTAEQGVDVNARTSEYQASK